MLLKQHFAGGMGNQRRHLKAIGVARGDIEMTAADVFTARAVKRFYPQLDIDTKLGFAQPCAWAFPKKSDRRLQQTFDAWLSDYKHTDDFGRLYRKYYR